MVKNKSLLTNDFYWFIDQLRFKIGFRNFFSNFICLLFLKYIISYSDKLEFKNINSYKEIMSFKRKYDAARYGYPLKQEDFYEVLKCIDEEQILGDIRLIYLVENYIEIFRDESSQKEIIELVEHLDFFVEPNAVGDVFESVLKMCATDVRKTMISITNQSLRELAKGLLKVTEKDIYLDCYSGYSSTLFGIDNYGKYIGYEINYETALISKMMLFMSGKKNVDIRVKNFLKEEISEKADKVFADGLISVRGDYSELCEKFGVQTKDGDVLSLFKIIDCVKEGGTAVITVHGKVLFSSANGYQELRRFLCSNGLKAVISLPPLWAGTTINTNILVVQKGYVGNIEFVEAKDLGNGDRRNALLRSGIVDKIIRHVNDNLSEVSFSASVDYRDVMCADIWLPNNYIEFKIENNYRNVSDIDDELDDLYAQLKNNL